MLNKIVKIIVIGIILLVVIQVIPYGRNHVNPKVTGEPKWDSPATRTTFMRVCGNCHSNETTWPWYSKIAPASWLVQSDVDEARENLNVSEWGRPGKNKGIDAAGEVAEDGMPPFFYMPAHPEAKMTDAEKDGFIKGLKATFGTANK